MPDEYARFARIYDHALNVFLDPLRRRAIRMLRRAGCRSVLDLCCGTGRQCVFSHAAGIKSAGVDLSPAMLDQARRKSPPDITYFRADAARPLFRDNAFDACLLSFALHEKAWDTRLAILDQAERQARRVLIIDFAGPAEASRAGLLLGSIPERLAGGAHYRNYRDHLRSGAVAGLLKGRDARIIDKAGTLMGAVGMTLYATDNHAL